MADPRKGENFDNVNRAILDDMVRHRLGLSMLSGGIESDVVSLLNEADSDIRRILQNRLEAGLSEGAARARHLQQMMDEIRRVNQQIHQDVGDKLKSELQDVSVSEAEHSAGVVNKNVPVSVGMTVPPKPLLKSIVSSQPFEGRTLSEWTQATAQDRVNKIRKAVQLGMAEGDSNQEIVRRVMGTGTHGFKDGVMNMGRNNVASVTRTAVTHVADRARQETYRRSNVVKSIQYVATLDSRTTIRCASLDGQNFNVGSGPRPPQHFACRSTTTPVTKSWRELGIDRDELEPSTRASMDGQVPETTNYSEWLSGQSNDVVEETLGKTRAKLWRDGNLDLSEMVRSNGRPIPLDELRTMESDVFEAADVSA